MREQGREKYLSKNGVFFSLVESLGREFYYYYGLLKTLGVGVRVGEKSEVERLLGNLLGHFQDLWIGEGLAWRVALGLEALLEDLGELEFEWGVHYTWNYKREIKKGKIN